MPLTNTRALLLCAALLGASPTARADCAVNAEEYVCLTDAATDGVCESEDLVHDALQAQIAEPECEVVGAWFDDASDPAVECCYETELWCEDPDEGPGCLGGGSAALLLLPLIGLRLRRDAR